MAKESKPKAAPQQTAEAAFIATANAGDDLLDTKATHAAKNDVPTGKALLQLKRHPLSEKYGPPTSDEEVAGMASDIQANGQHETIKLYEGMVLAGWTRYQACLRIGKDPRVENYMEDKPEAVAFGTNVIRRRLSSISKAYMGAQFYLAMQDSATPPRQQDLAKQCTVSLNRLSQCIQLLRLDTDEGKAAQKVLRTNPEVTNTQFDEMLLECGIARTASKPAEEPSRARIGPEEDDLSDLDDLEESDLTGGAIDKLLDGEDDLEDEGEDAPRQPKPRREIGEGAAPIPAVGASRGTEVTRPQETVVSKLSKHFNNLSPSEQVQFVSFAWKKLGPALSQAITDGKVKFEMPSDVPEGKAKGSAYKKQVDATKPPKEAKPATPAQLAAREKFAAASKAKAAEKAGQAATEAPAKVGTPKAARGKAATAPAKPTPAKGAKATK